MLNRILVIFLIVLAFAPAAWADDIELPEGVVGYRFYYKAPGAGGYSDSILVGDSSKPPTMGLVEGSAYCFVATTVYADGNESPHSAETCMDNAPKSVLVLRLTENTRPVVMMIATPQVGTTTATISWVTERACGPASARYYSPEIDKPWVEIKSNNLPTTDHIVTLSGLKARTAYRYIVDAECDGTRIESGERSFNTK